MSSDKVRENRLRRLAKKYDLLLTKSRRRDPDAVDYGLYALVNEFNGTVNPALADRWIHSWTLDDVEAYLTD